MRYLHQPIVSKLQEIYDIIETSLPTSKLNFFTWATVTYPPFEILSNDLTTVANKRSIQDLLKQRKSFDREGYSCIYSPMNNSYIIEIPIDFAEIVTIKNKDYLMNAVLRWVMVRLAERTNIVVRTRILTANENLNEGLIATFELCDSDRKENNFLDLEVTLLAGLKMLELLIDPKTSLLIDYLFVNYYCKMSQLWDYQSETGNVIYEDSRTFKDNLLIACNRNGITKVELFSEGTIVKIVPETEIVNSGIRRAAIYIESDLQKTMKKEATHKNFWGFVLTFLATSKLGPVSSFFVLEDGTYEIAYPVLFSKHLLNSALNNKSSFHDNVLELYYLHLAEEITFNTLQHQKFTSKQSFTG